MKNWRGLIQVLFVVLVMGTLYWFINRNDDSNLAPAIKSSSKSFATDNPSSFNNSMVGTTEIIKTNFVEKARGEVPFSAKENLLMADLNVEKASVRRILRAVASAIEPIEFYVKVVDQYGDPVAGVKVRYSVDTSPAFGGPLIFFANTDTQGRFSITDIKGAAVSFYSFTKDGYVIDKNGGGLFTFHIRSGNLKKNLKTYTLNNPFVVKGWKVARAEQLIESKIGGSKAIVSNDGQQHSIFFRSRNVVVEEGASKSADLIVSVTAIRQEDDRGIMRRHKWSMIMETRGGGIIKTQDLYMYEAPEAGYQTSWEVDFEPSISFSVSPLHNQRFYLLAHDGKSYGRFVLDIYPFGRKQAGLYFTYAINPSGSRNLFSGKQQ